jgi:hypothetical protein
MDGDGSSGLALAIAVAIALLVLGAMVAFVSVGRATSRKLAPRRRRLVVGGMGLVGIGIGWILVMATFFEASWAPPPQLHVVTPGEFSAPVVILLEDPEARQGLKWRETWLPFTAPTAEIVVPHNGIVRVRSFGPMKGRADLDTVWSSGTQGFGAGGGPGPPGSGATSYLIIERPDVSAANAVQFYDTAALAAYVEQAERRR